MTDHHAIDPRAGDPRSTVPRRTRAASWRRRVVAPLLVLALGGWVAWLSWRLTSFETTPIAVLALIVEVVGWTAGVLVITGLASARPDDRPCALEQTSGPARYATAVAARVGGVRTGELRGDLLVALRHLRNGSVTPADRTMLGVLLDGPRRLLIVATLTLALLVGVAPLPLPPWWALAAVLAGSGCAAAALIAAADGAVRPGDRTRWSFASLGELVSAADQRDVAPRSWVGTVAAIVVLSLAIALRGVSDRWTHGLPAMTDGERLVTMSWAAAIVAGALFTLRTLPAPQLGNAHVVARRLEERSARRSAVGTALGAGMIGLLAGILPGGVDAADDQPARVEPVAEVEADPSG